MGEYVLLDSGPLGHACQRRGMALADRCRLWIDGLMARGVDVVVPEVADYEVRRELIRTNALGSLRRLDDLVATGGLSYLPVTTAAWRLAASLWADARQRGVPTASAQALDADVILAASATMMSKPGDQVIVATVNVSHLARYCDARLWTTVT